MKLSLTRTSPGARTGFPGDLACARRPGRIHAGDPDALRGRHDLHPRRGGMRSNGWTPAGTEAMPTGLRPVAGGTPALPGPQPAFGSGYAGLGEKRRLGQSERRLRPGHDYRARPGASITPCRYLCGTYDVPIRYLDVLEAGDGQRLADGLDAVPVRCLGVFELKFRDSLTEMDSRFRGNDVISARHVTFRLVVIPAKAGIHRLIQAF